MPLAERPTDPPPQPVAGHTPDSDRPPGDASQTSPALTDEEKLRAFRIAEEARGQFLTWLKWTFGFFVLFLGLLGLKGYNDWTAMLEAHKKELDGKVHQQVEENLKANYKTRTDEVLDSAVKARTEITVSSRIVSDLQKQSKDLEAELNRFHEKLASLEKQAEGKATELTSRLGRIAADFLGPEGQWNQRIREQDFLNKSRAYAAKLALTLQEPRIVFREDRTAPGMLLATYDTEENVYVVSPSKLDTPGLPEYAALMGRFFEKNRDVLKNVGRPGFPDVDLWQNFRQSVVNYVLVKDGFRLEPHVPHDQLDFYRTLTAMEKKAGAASIRKLATALLEAFGQDWNTANFFQKVLAVNEKVKALSAEDVKEAFTGMPR